MLASTVAALLVAAGCSAQGGGDTATTGTQPVLPQTRNARRVASPDTSVLKDLKNQVVIGSTIDPVNGAANPYGLTVAPATSGQLTAGDLVVCNFNSKFGTQSSGRSIVALHPTPGASPLHLIANRVLLGCDALALAADDTIWAASMVANDTAIVSSSGGRLGTISGKPFCQPWGQVYAAPPS